MNIKNHKSRNIRINDIKGLHPEINSLGTSFNNLFLNSESGKMTNDALNNFLVLHPIQLIKHNEHYLVIGGLRSYQLAVACMKLDDKVPSFIHSKLTHYDIRTLAETDILVSRTAHSLGAKPAAQIKKLIDEIGKDASEQLLPGIGSLRGITRKTRE